MLANGLCRALEIMQEKDDLPRKTFPELDNVAAAGGLQAVLIAIKDQNEMRDHALKRVSDAISAGTLSASTVSQYQERIAHAEGLSDRMEKEFQLAYRALGA